MKILYAENHAIFAAQVCQQFLSDHTVRVSPNLVSAREALASEKYDVLLIDYDLDDGKGDELVNACRVSHPELRIIAVSAHEAGNAALLSAGAHAVCSKMDFDKIQTVIGSPAPTRKEPVLETTRLVLRPLQLDDAPMLAKLAGRREIADTTLSIPHPYSQEQARKWLETQIRPGGTSHEIVFAITLKENGHLIGTMGLREIDQEHSQAELGFWVGVEFWRKGYATEASAAVLRYGFEELKLNRIYAHYMTRNPASGRVLEKIGMKREGLLRQRVKKWGVFEDVILLAILREDRAVD
jgi:RimJ/RimL family protein N-acetyltransferase